MMVKAVVAEVLTKEKVTKAMGKETVKAKETEQETVVVEEILQYSLRESPLHQSLLRQAC